MNKNQIQFIVDEVDKTDKLSVLMTSTHPMTDTNICANQDVTFYNLKSPQFPIQWPPDIPLPYNMKLIASIDELPHRPDIILSQNVVDQYNAFKQLSYMFDCPMIEFEHTLPAPDWIAGKMPQKIKQQMQAQAYVYISNFSRKEWCREEDGDVIYHMVDKSIYNGWCHEKDANGKAMLLVNQIRGREWAVGNPVSLMLKDKKELIDLYGHNPGFNSTPLSKADVISKMREYSVFINTSLRSPIPASLLEAAAVGIPIISTKTCAIPEFFVHGESILFYETEEECLDYVDQVINNTIMAHRLSKGASLVIDKFFNQERYVADWNKVFAKAIANYVS